MKTKLTLENTGDDNPFHHEAEAGSFDRAAVMLLEEVILHYDVIPPDLFTALAELADCDGDGEHVRSDFSTPEENFTLKRIEVIEKPEPKEPAAALTDGLASKALALFQNTSALAVSGAASVYSPEEIAFLKEQEPGFEFEKAKPIFSRRENYYLNFIHGSRYRHEEYGFEVIEGPICASHYEGAGRVDIGRWKAGLYYETMSMQNRPLAIILFAIRRGKTLYIVTMRESMDELPRGFALHPEKLKQGFEYIRRVPPAQERYDDDSGRRMWREERQRRGIYGSDWSRKRVPILTLAREGWEFNPECYPVSVFPKPDEKAAVKFRESGKGRHDCFHLISNGAGVYAFFSKQDYFRKNGFIDLRIKDARGVREERYQWSREAGDDRGKTEKLTLGGLDGERMDATFESYILSYH